jgi:NTE family protein
MASRAQLSAREQAGQVAEIWHDLRKRDVLVGLGGPRMLLRAVGHALGFPDVGLASLLDPSPLAASLERWIDWGAIGRNVRGGAIDAICVVATLLATGQPVGFVESREGMPVNADETVRYVKTRLRGEHVRASAAIPVLFPTVQVTTPRNARGHYTDGGTRLNSAIKPAIDLGAHKVIVIGLQPFVRRPGGHAMLRRPSIADVVANVLDGLLVDQVANDYGGLPPSTRSSSKHRTPDRSALPGHTGLRAATPPTV